MIDLQFELGEFQFAARKMGAALDQVPFALATSLNESALAARKHEIDSVWPGHVTVRNRSFLGAALRTDFATKRRLAVAVFDRLGRAHLAKHDKGGTKQARGRLAIPSDRIRRSGKGVAARQKPKALPNSFRKGDAIYQRTGARGQHLKLMYVLKPSARIKPEVPFRAAFDEVMRREVRERFGAAMLKAMRTRR